MENKILKRLNYVSRVLPNSHKLQGAVRDVIRDVHKNERIWEYEMSDKEDEVMLAKRRRQTDKMLLTMAGVYVSDTIRDETIRFLYDNMEEIREKNPEICLSVILLRLQQVLDYTYMWADICEIDKKVFTIKELKSLQKEINETIKEEKKLFTRKS